MDLLSALHRFSSETLCSLAADKIASRPEVFSPMLLVTPGLADFLARTPATPVVLEAGVRRLWSGAAENLLGKSEFPPRAPVDWHFDVKIGCSCADCAELQAFVADPAERVRRFRVNEARRSHLQGAIDGYRLPMTHVTERGGSPRTLVCTKDRRNFEARMKEYAGEIEAMRTLVSLAPRSGDDVLTRRMEAAVRAHRV